MKEFFTVVPIEKVFEYLTRFPAAGAEKIPILESNGRVIAEDIVSDTDIPGFDRSTMDGYAVASASTFGATEGTPAYLALKGNIAMGERPAPAIGSGEAMRIATGGMLPEGADSVIMVEHTAEIDESTIEVYKSVPPGSNVIAKGEDIRAGWTVIPRGTRIRPQEAGLLAALGRNQAAVYRKPAVGIISTGDEIVPIEAVPGPAQVRDVNTYTLSGMIAQAGGIPVQFGLVADDFTALLDACRTAIANCDMVIISGGSSVGTRDLTLDVISALPDPEILVHGISISPGKPAILAEVSGKPFWGLPGHVTSAMIVFDRVVRPFIEHIGGLQSSPHADRFRLTARLTRNVASAQGRVDFIRVRLIPGDDGLLAEPVLGKSGLLNTMLKADGLIEIGLNTEGLDKGTVVPVILF